MYEYMFQNLRIIAELKIKPLVLSSDFEAAVTKTVYVWANFEQKKNRNNKE